MSASKNASPRNLHRLSPDQGQVAEVLAPFLHHEWVKRLKAGGWRHGPDLVKDRREHPDLLPFEELTDDRKSDLIQKVIQTIIPSLVSEHSAVSQPGPFHFNDDEKCGNDYLGKGMELYQGGDLLMLLEEMEEALELWPDILDLQLLKALALMELGVEEEAGEILLRLQGQGAGIRHSLLFPELTRRILCSPMDSRVKKNHFDLALDHYRQMYREAGRHDDGVKAARMAFLTGKKDLAVGLARQAADGLKSLSAGKEWNAEQRFGLVSNLGELSLILGNFEQALSWYDQAGAIARKFHLDLGHVRMVARLMVEYGDGDAGAVAKALRHPVIAVFSGHMVDKPGRPVPRFPPLPELEAAVAQAIRERLEAHEVGIGYTCAAAGSDMLFIEALREKDHEVHVVLPFNIPHFIRNNTAIDPRMDGRGRNVWRNQFEALVMDLEKSGRLTYAADWFVGHGGGAYVYTNLMIFGLAKQRARQLETEVVPLALWDGLPGDGPGGAAGTVEWWASQGYQPEVIDLKELRARHAPHIVIPEAPAPTSLPSQAPTMDDFIVQIMGILFADVVGYSKMREDHVPHFVKYFMGAVARMLEESLFKPVAKNTWGDALYLVFPTVRAAGVFALDLVRTVRDTPWEDHGLPEDLNLRVGLHAGPVYACLDPVTGQATYTGTHVSRAARIEPVTPPGEVYASEAFACLAAAEDIRDFSCVYVGRQELAKNYGVFRTYHVREG